MIATEQYFHTVPFILKYFANEIWNLSWVLILGTPRSERGNSFVQNCEISITFELQF